MNSLYRLRLRELPSAVEDFLPRTIEALGVVPAGRDPAGSSLRRPGCRRSEQRHRVLQGVHLLHVFRLGRIDECADADQHATGADFSFNPPDSDIGDYLLFRLVELPFAIRRSGKDTSRYEEGQNLRGGG